MSASVSEPSTSPSDSAQGLRVVFDMLLQGMALESLDPETIDWRRPIFVIRSAHMDRMRAFLHQVHLRCRTPQLHVMSHGRDEAAIRAMAPFDIVFHPYPKPGRYRLEDLEPDTLAGLRAMDFGSVFFLDPGTTGDGLEDVERIVAAICEERAAGFRGDESYVRATDRRRRQLSESAFTQLAEWYHFIVETGAPV